VFQAVSHAAVSNNNNCFVPVRGAKYWRSACVCVYVCLSLCLSARISKPHVEISRNFPYLLPVAVAQLSSDDNTIRYVLPVLFMTSFSRNGAKRLESKTTHIIRRVCDHCVCPLAYLKTHTSKLHKTFSVCYLWPWLYPPLTTIR